MKIAQVVLDSARFLENGPPDLRCTTRLDAELLLCHILNCSREYLVMNRNEEISEGASLSLSKKLNRRLSGEPLQYITGRAHFYGLEFAVGQGVLIPRPESEHLVEEVIRFVKDSAIELPQILDLGAGSGCLGISCLVNIENAYVWGIDISEVCIEFANVNAKNLGVSARFSTLCLDLGREITLTGLLGPKPVDVIIANPPYVSEGDPQLSNWVKLFEPAQALFSPANGTEHITNWVHLSKTALRKGGILVMEFGYQQSDFVESFFKSDHEFERVRIERDLSGQERYVVAHRR